MRENFRYHMALGAYLTTADRHYLDSRILWHSNSHFGASMPLWLAIEQMIKLYIVQSRVENRSLGSVRFKDKGATVTLTYNPTESNMEVAFSLLSRSFYNLSPKHKPEPLVQHMQGLLDISSYRRHLEKVNELYERRYYVNKGTSIPKGTFQKMDELYFKLRNAVSNNIPRSLMDEIAYQKKFDTGHPLRNFIYAYYENPYFQAKEHPMVFQALPNGKIIANNGTSDPYLDITPKSLVHPAVKKLDY